MSGKRILAWLCAIMMLLSVVSASAAGSTPKSLQYTGGIVRRVTPRGSSDELIQLAYTLTDMPYIVLNNSYQWKVFVSGGSGDYTIEASLAHQDSLDMDPFADLWMVAASLDASDGLMSYTFTEHGRYFWQFTVTDSNGQELVFQTRIYEAYSTADESDATTTVGKVNELVAQLITDDMSDYSRALVLHDWLIHNANYDYTYSNYDAGDVLLEGSGVCDSYARAYLMLCTAAGLECIYVSGTAGGGSNTSTWGNHGWNLVKLGGNWYHVDCTWDDPGEGGYEHHNYFCVTDEQMAKDHRWNQPDDLFDYGGMVVPDADGGEYANLNSSTADYDFTFSTIAEFADQFSRMVAAGDLRESTIGLYVGSDNISTVYNEFNAWTHEMTSTLVSSGFGVTSTGTSRAGSMLTFWVWWEDPSPYLRIDETNMFISIGEERTLQASEVVASKDVFTWKSSNPAVATVSAEYTAGSTPSVTATIVGVGPGTTTITATAKGGLSDSITVTVMPAYVPDFNLTVAENAGNVELSWNSIPGVTVYQVMQTLNGETNQLLSTTDTKAVFTAQQLPSTMEHTLYVVAKRQIGNKVLTTYTSPSCVYGENILSFKVFLPASTTVIEAEAFAGDSKLTSIALGNQVTSIGSKAFANCSALGAIQIPASVTSIATDAFTGSPLQYAAVVEGSYAEQWIKTNMPDVTLVH